MKIKVKFSAWWGESSFIHDHLKQMYISNTFADDDIEFTDNDDYDFLIVGGIRNAKDVDVKVDKHHVIYFSMEPFWQDNRIDEDAHEISSRVFITNKYDLLDRPEYIESYAYSFYTCDCIHYSQPSVDYKWSLDYILSDHHAPKKWLVSIVQSKHSWKPIDHPSILYADRNALAKTIAMRDNNLIPIWGKYWDEDDDNIYYNVHGPCADKLSILEKSYFNVAIENTAEVNYITEKFWDPILTETIPIYSGPPNIRELIPYNCFLLIPDIKDTNGTIKFIEENATVEVYNSMKSELKALKHEYLSSRKYNLWHKIRHEIYASNKLSIL